GYIDLSVLRNGRTARPHADPRGVATSDLRAVHRGACAPRRVRMKLVATLVSILLGAGQVLSSGERSAQGSDPAKLTENERLGPGPEPMDRWNPRRDIPVEPAYGGTLRIHTESLPPNLNGALTSSTYAHNMLYELHATLVQRDWESWKFQPVLASRWEVADTL